MDSFYKAKLAIVVAGAFSFWLTGAIYVVNATLS